jgi:hypothetical protein
LADIAIGDSAANNGKGTTYVIYGKQDNNPVSTSTLGSHGFTILEDRANGLRDTRPRWQAISTATASRTHHRRSRTDACGRRTGLCHQRLRRHRGR